MAMLGFSVNLKTSCMRREDLAARLPCRPHGQTSLFRIGGPAVYRHARCRGNVARATNLPPAALDLSVALLMHERRSAEQRCSCLTGAAAWLGSTEAARLRAEFEETLQQTLHYRQMIIQ